MGAEVPLVVVARVDFQRHNQQAEEVAQQDRVPLAALVMTDRVMAAVAAVGFLLMEVPLAQMAATVALVFLHL